LIAGIGFQRIYQWLSPPDPSENQNRALEQCHQGTGQWFIQGKIFASFKRQNKSFLWLNGIPGCGKTVLCSSVIEDLGRESSKSLLRKLYFYFDFNDARKQTLESALRSLLWQAANSPGSSLEGLQELYFSCEKGAAQPCIASLSQSLEKALLLDGTAIVIDALDECTTRSALLSWLKQMVRHNIGNVKFIVTSRKEQEIEVKLREWLTEDADVPLQQCVVDTDIGAYVNERLRKDPHLQRWQTTPKIQDEIEAKLRSGAHGM
jgi:Cdc6-like AAA superfamily ATPase